LTDVILQSDAGYMRGAGGGGVYSCALQGREIGL
jgi:hypothetical protein